MRDLGGAEENVAGANGGHVVPYPVTTGPRGDEIKFVAQMRNLWTIGGSSGEPDLEISVNEHLSRSPRCAREGKRGSKR